ncbi:hypothetical protein ABPG72_020179 [Tetrahymena utriculariae]
MIYTGQLFTNIEGLLMYKRQQLFKKLEQNTEQMYSGNESKKKNSGSKLHNYQKRLSKLIKNFMQSEVQSKYCFFRVWRWKLFIAIGKLRFYQILRQILRAQDQTNYGYGLTRKWKTQILNFLILQFQNAEVCTEIFTTGKQLESYTRGIKYYFPKKINEKKDQKDKIAVFFIVKALITQQAFRDMLRQGTKLNDEQQNKIINEYLTLDSIKPDEIRQYEQYKNKIRIDQDVHDRRFLFSLICAVSSAGVLVEAQSMVAAGIIVMIGIGTLVLTSGLLLLSGVFIYKITSYSKQKSQITSISKKLKDTFYQSIAKNEIVQNRNEQNFYKLLEILKSQIPRFEQKVNLYLRVQEIYQTCFLMLINLISTPFDEQQLRNLQNNQPNNPHFKDLKLLSIAIYQAKQLKQNQTNR